MLRNSPSYLFTELPYVRKPKTILNSGFHAVDSGFQVQDLSLELGFGTPIISGNPDSLSCMPDPKARDSGLHKQKVSGFPYIGRTEWIKKNTIN